MSTFEFVITNILMVSLGTILYLVVRALPRIDEEPATEKKGIFERLVTSEIPEKVDAAINSFLVKVLRRIKVLILKIDNSISSRLKKIKSEENGGAAKPIIDFKEITGQNKNGEEKIKE